MPESRQIQSQRALEPNGNVMMYFGLDVLYADIGQFLSEGDMGASLGPEKGHVP